MNWKFSNSINNRWTLITFFLGVCITTFITAQIESNNRERITKAAQSASDHAVKAVKERITLYQYGLRGARGAVLSVGKDNLSRRVFLRYSLSRDTDQEFPGARGFGFIRRVTQADTDRFVREAQQDGWLDFHIKELAPNNGERYVIQYIEPVSRNLQAVGLDIASEKNRREAAKAAIDSGEVRLTGPITLVQATGNPLQSFLILMPIYQGGMVPKTQEKRHQLAFGWSYAPLLMREVMLGLDLDNTDSHIELYDVTDPSHKERFFSNDEKASHGLYDQKSVFTIFGRKWESHFSVYPSFIEGLHLPKPIDVFGIGILISFLSATLIGVTSVSRRSQKEVIAQQAKMAAIVESSSDAIISTSLYGVVTSWNSGATKIFGYQQQEALGESIYHLIIPTSQTNTEKEIYKRIELGEEIDHFDTVRKTKSGEDIAVSVAVSPVYGLKGEVVGASKSIRDISQQKAAEEKIRDLNNSLEKQVKDRTEELQKLNLLLNDVLDASSEIAIIATDINGNISLFNSGAQRMLKYDADEVIGKLTLLSFHVEDEIEQVRKHLIAEFEDPVASGLATLFYRARLNESDYREWTYKDKFGSTFDVSVVITPMHDDQGDVIGFLNMAIDITEQKKSNAEVISMRDQLLMAANVSQLGIWSWSIDSNELDWNDMMFHIYQQPISLRETGVNYRHWEERLHPDDKALVEEELQKALQGLGEFSLTFRIVLPDGHIRHIQARAYVEFDRQGQPINLTGINRDVTSEQELETWLRRAKDEADAASSAKSDFLANMSHEIRTPMNAVLGMLQLVKRTELSDQQEDYISKAHIAARSLLGLINDILDYSKVDAGKLEIERAPFEMKQLLSELNTLLSGYSNNPDVELRYNIDPNIPPYLIGDYLRVLQVLTNLSSNALKFTLQGKVNVSITQVSCDDESTELLFKVADTGIGIAPSKIENIFEVFSQAESSTARRFGGSGLGLVICRRLVKLMQGELKVESELGKGSCFYFTVRFPIVAKQDIERLKGEKNVMAIHSGQNKLNGLSILVVEDNAFNRQVAEELLIAEGAVVTLAEGGEDGISILLDSDDSAFDLVLMDMQMPNVDGLEATRRVRREPRFTSLPIVAMTANVSLSDQQACLKAGMNGHIAKPLDIDIMIDVICQQVGRLVNKAVEEEAATPSELHELSEMTQHSQEEKSRVENKKSIMARFAGNQALYKSLVDHFLKESDELISQVEEGINKQDGSAVRQQLHTLKGSTGTMGLTELSNEIAEVEQFLKGTENLEDMLSKLAEINVSEYRQRVKDDLESVLRELDD